MEVIGHIVLGVIVLALASQWLLVRKARQAEGQPLPALNEFRSG